MATISIVLPTYNGEKYIAKSIESCLSQSYKNFELLIIDDCSSDNTPCIIKDFAARDSRIKIITNRTNQKLPACLNLGFENATGDYYTWTSDDNYYAENALEKLVFELNANNNIDIVYSAYQFIDDKDNQLDLYGNVHEHLLFNCTVGACFLYRNNVHKSIGGYDVTKFRMEDMDFWLKCASSFQFKYIPDNLYSYRKHADSLTSEIHSNEKIKNDYRKHYQDSFAVFFKKSFNLNLLEDELKTHVNLFFENFEKKEEFEIAEEAIQMLMYLDKLKTLKWEKINFDSTIVIKVITEKRNRVIRLLLNNMAFKIKFLEKKNPSLSKHINKPISWYYKEYEVLPRWYKKIGHIIKAFQGNRSWRSLIGKEGHQ